MTKREAAVIMTATQTTLLFGWNITYYFKYVSELMGRPVFSSEIPRIADELQKRAMPEFKQIVNNLEE